MESTNRILRTPAAADYVGLSPSTLERMRLSGDGPTFIRLGGRAVGYDINDLDAWLDEQRDNGEGDVPTASTSQG
ncbi:MAG: AlpA family phage regulatory protein [bacterium]|nr:AlpA family phage regulatory protein [bacterium]